MLQRSSMREMTRRGRPPHPPPPPKPPPPAVRGGHFDQFQALGQPGGARTSRPPKKADATQLVLSTYMRLGGLEGMIAWAKDNPTDFYIGMFSRLIPKVGPVESGDSYTLIINKLFHPEQKPEPVQVNQAIEHHASVSTSEQSP